MYTTMITGGLGSGKSTLRALLCKKGAISIDLDAIARSLLQNDEQMGAEIIERFGEGVVDDTGAIVASRLAQCAFADEESTQALNAITFPRIVERATEYVLDVHCAPLSDAKIMVVEVPLLSEVPEFAALADEVIAVSAPGEIRLARAIARGMDAGDALQRIQAQPTDAQRAALADTICNNGGSVAELEAWADAWWDARMASLNTEVKGARDESGTQ